MTPRLSIRKTAWKRCLLATASGPAGLVRRHRWSQRFRFRLESRRHVQVLSRLKNRRPENVLTLRTSISRIKKTWMHVATFAPPDGGKKLTGLYSFIEDFRRDTPERDRSSPGDLRQRMGDDRRRQMGAGHQGKIHRPRRDPGKPGTRSMPEPREISSSCKPVGIPKRKPNLHATMEREAVMQSRRKFLILRTRNKRCGFAESEISNYEISNSETTPGTPACTCFAVRDFFVLQFAEIFQKDRDEVLGVACCFDWGMPVPQQFCGRSWRLQPAR